MKNRVKMTLAIIGIFLIVCEFFYGIPFLGGSVILSFGWQPLLFNAFLYLVLTIILLVDNQNAIKPMVIIPIIGIIGSFVAVIPVVGMIIHWILFFLMIFFVFIVLSAPTYLPNKNAKVIYTQYKNDTRDNNENK
ncbi:hypothetical protein [Staphylococcus saccharolyticus]|uniref:Permease n=1 Tax=Staphylococcus saccharolyticus TaxID=33028 RepID=A0A380H1Y2_9STAP|nr:hypothetical protein [Staphylococcus saccharolyticus]MBL7564895.1 hypothetical protein [Staphylococcus saccharolyticus]MBL7570841.1 hypothetical protein [Staphylococcus saccharolyticus]QQB98706.1 hypothetical protein I6I31_01190 [Staphylococcus saccharolyticus]QRJ67079.1 hypothetical protein DMB76_003155 [Staphylococcus saccharolyticus]RTX97024.1 hypothetical protein CD145_05260 [Staphylococcus saccharolyticus]